MKFYSDWQDALFDFIRHNGSEYPEPIDLFSLLVEFESQLQQNTNGAYYLRLDGRN